MHHLITRLLLLLSLVWMSTSAQAAEEFWEYTFRPGDTLWNIAEQYTNSVNNWSELQRINQIDQGTDRQILPGTRIRIPVAMLKRQPQPAVVIAVNGQPRHQRNNGDDIVISLDSKIYSGDRIITAAGQNLRLRLADGSELQIEENSEIHFDKLSYHEDTGMVDTRLRLPRGRLDTRVQKLKPKSRYQIQTPAAITAVRGTAFRLSSDENGISRTEVTEGIVAVSAGGETRQVETGFGIIAEVGKTLTEPVQLLTAPLLAGNQARVANALDVSWQAVNGAVKYRYRVATDAEFNRVIAAGNVADTRLVLTDLSAGTYHVRVRALDRFELQGLESRRSYDLVAASQPNTLEQILIPSGVLLLGQ